MNTHVVHEGAIDPCPARDDSFPVVPRPDYFVLGLPAMYGKAYYYLQLWDTDRWRTFEKYAGTSKVTEHRIPLKGSTYTFPLPYRVILCEEDARKEEIPPDFVKLGTAVGMLVAEKNKAYGDSFAKCGDFLRLLYPNGIKPEQYGDALALVRVFDKQMRIATDKDALGESPWQDVASYGLLGMAATEKRHADARKEAGA